MITTIRSGEKKDIPFLASVMFIAARSHLQECPWSIIFSESETRTLRLLTHLTQISNIQWSYVSNFWIAEIDGKPAAAMCGFAPTATVNMTEYESELDVAKRIFNYSEAKLSGVYSRLMIAESGFPEDQSNTWGIENVAVLPEYRGRGLVDRLFEHVLQLGSHHGYKQAQILSLIGNETGQRVFERNGFNVIKEKQNTEFEILLGTPGAKLLTQNL